VRDSLVAAGTEDREEGEGVLEWEVHALSRPIKSMMVHIIPKIDCIFRFIELHPDQRIFQNASNRKSEVIL
jgi:hypothetical protein